MATSPRTTASAASKAKPRKKTTANVADALIRRRPVCPDQLDLRDRLYQPPVGLQPAKMLMPTLWMSIKNQLQTEACTGFALSTVIEYLLSKGKRENKPAISPYMLYSMARRYDEIPEAPNAEPKLADSGSTLRGALKGWYKQGACAAALWPNLDMPPATNLPETDWWIDSVQRPLGAYYRVDPLSISDMHVALNDLGVLYASAACHAGWTVAESAAAKLASPPAAWKDYWRIPSQKAGFDDGGHAFVIVGYNEDGFLIQNSWGTGWGSAGYAILTYSDWQNNAMDCWAPQLGVITAEHTAISEATTLRENTAGNVVVASSEVLANREINPFIIDLGNNGELSQTGDFRTRREDVEDLVDFHLGQARKRWNLSASDTIDIAIYAHGGLNDEKAAAAAAKEWIPLLYDAKIFPIFLMWETGAMTTILNLIVDAFRQVPRSTGGVFSELGDAVKQFYDKRLERALATPGTLLWGEMKQNADALSGNPQSGLQILQKAFLASDKIGKFRLHLIGHSAGSIVHSFIIDRLAAQGLRFASLNLMAPAVRVDTFERLVLPHLISKTVDNCLQFSLTDEAENKDPTCRPYLRSLLYLVSESFEAGVRTPILGMDKYVRLSPVFNLPNFTYITTPSADSINSTHGGFDNDVPTQKKIVAQVLRSKANVMNRTGVGGGGWWAGEPAAPAKTSRSPAVAAKPKKPAAARAKKG
ncbi:C1 family peptidase [Pseudomonas sp. C1C7]|uniref:C1 family peptidase n=1 Tax=Pseudomonas sp. C1C7 TaxID=2735272 RepID=UPI001585FB4D|nr:C1 family peptidase [Pseudomonas sp. C1C7]NUT77731.1 C1 family peptidase [Pseudomonas sp. C1C7]